MEWPIPANMVWTLTLLAYVGGLKTFNIVNLVKPTVRDVSGALENYRWAWILSDKLLATSRGLVTLEMNFKLLKHLC
jgi:hypothetical protein